MLAALSDGVDDWAAGMEVFGNAAMAVIAIMAMILGNLGYSVYHIAMYRNANSDIMLLNVIYQELAAFFQLYLSIIAINVRMSSNKPVRCDGSL